MLLMFSMMMMIMITTMGIKKALLRRKCRARWVRAAHLLCSAFLAPRERERRWRRNGRSACLFSCVDKFRWIFSLFSLHYEFMSNSLSLSKNL